MHVHNSRETKKGTYNISHFLRASLFNNFICSSSLNTRVNSFLQHILESYLLLEIHGLLVYFYSTELSRIKTCFYWCHKHKHRVKHINTFKDKHKQKDKKTRTLHSSYVVLTATNVCMRIENCCPLTANDAYGKRFSSFTILYV